MKEKIKQIKDKSSIKKISFIIVSIIAIIILSNIIYATMELIDDESGLYYAVSDFLEDMNLFCLDHGSSFPQEGKTKYYQIYKVAVKNGGKEGEYIDPKIDEKDGNGNYYYPGLRDKIINSQENYHKLSYILSERERIGNIERIGSSPLKKDPLQVAIWLIRNNQDSDVTNEGKELYAGALAYEKYITQANLQIAPTVEASTAKKNGKIVGPFTIKYAEPQSGTFQSVTEYYGEITSIKLNNSTVTACDVAGNSLSSDKLICGYPKPNQSFYLKVANEAQIYNQANSIEVDFNNGYRNCDFSIYYTFATDSSGKTLQDIMQGEGSSEPKPIATIFTLTTPVEPPIIPPIIPSVNEMVIAKSNSQTGVLIGDARFNVECSGDIVNIRPSSTQSGVFEVEWSTDPSSWEIKSSNRKSSVVSPTASGSPQPINWEQTGYQEGTITIEEIIAPTGYKKINGKITIKVERYGKRTGIEWRGYDREVAIPCPGCPGECNRRCDDPCYIDHYIRHESGYHGYNYYFSNPTSPSVNNWNNWANFYDYSSKVTRRDSTILKAEFPKKEGDSISINNDRIILDIYDIPILRLGGEVWQDGEIEGGKETEAANWFNDPSESAMSGIRVRLYATSTNGKILEDINGNNIFNSRNQVIRDLYGNSLENVKTNSSGKYEFKNVELGSNYYVEFEYDGINYYTTTQPTRDSRVSETDRSYFNSKFATITGSSTSANRTIGSSNSYPSGLEYTHQGNNAILKTVEGSEVIEKYRMYAKSANYLSDTSRWLDTWNTNNYMNINMGLRKRELDLSLSKAIEKATVTINNKTEVYEYDKLIEDEYGNIKIVSQIGETNNPDDRTYNLWLYRSDYNFRIEDYVEDEDIINTINPVSKGDFEALENSKQGTELEVEVKYQIAINNHTGHNGVQVNQVIDYFDKDYDYVGASYLQYNRTGNKNLGKPGVIVDTNTTRIDGKDYKKLTINLTGVDIGAFGSQIIELTFKARKTDDKNRALTLGVHDNIAEISSYTTTEGLIDKNSAPSNMIVNGSLREENDTGKAKGLEIEIRKDDERTWAGHVWEDIKTITETSGYKHGNGKDDNEAKVNQVIVQLIELVDITTGTGANAKTRQYEYIWQETTTGPNGNVKSLVSDGYNKEKVIIEEKTVKEDGKYKFVEFIPGEYIVRFIYGDGTYADYGINDLTNVKKYNGQDYKSAIRNSATENKAVDNEARRIETMAYSSYVDKEKGKLLNDMIDRTKSDSEQNTKRVNQLISKEAKGEITTAEKAELEKLQETTIAGAYSKTRMCAEVQRLNIGVEVKTTENMNFGLEKRPEAKLDLEKHITALKISTLEGTILDTSLVDENGKKLLDLETGVNRIDNLIPIKGNRNSRGSWTFETDTDKLVKGSNLEAEYTYTVRNNGEVEYLSRYLVSEYNSKTDEKYKELLTEKAAEVKTAIKAKSFTNGTYLGNAYFTGTVGSQDELVTSKTKLQEYVNNELSFDTSTEKDKDVFFKKNNSGVVEKIVYNDDANRTKRLEKINTVVELKDPTKPIIVNGGSNSDSKIILTRTLSGADDTLTYASYLAEIKAYSNATGRRDKSSVPDNLEYVHSDSVDLGLTANDLTDEHGNKWKGNEEDETWAETIIIRKPTGETGLGIDTLVLIITSTAVIIGAGIILIKKFVIKK